MKSQVDLLVNLLRDAGDSLGFSPSRDILTVRERCREEGEPFLSIALPRLDDLLLEGLRAGSLPAYVGWKSRCAYPEFLRDLWMRVFNADGVLLDMPSVQAIKWIRQISRFHKKIFEVCSDDRVEAAVDRWVQLDAELPSRADIKSNLDPYASKVAAVLFGRIIGEALTAPFKGANGPGAVSERLGTNSRWNFTSVSQQAQDLVGPEFFRPTWYYVENEPVVTKTEPARLEAVPKTAEKPRLICIEASYNQFLQQHMMRKLRGLLEVNRSVCSFVDQSINRSMALEGSVGGDKTATLDLSDASDRISLALVEELFGFNPSFLRYLRLSRSAFASLPDGRLVLMNKFASMGSALTFPVEAMVFTTLVVTSICRQQNDFSARNIKLWGKRGRGLSVYGDDIIVPMDYPKAVIRDLEAVGLKVNESKSFLSGKFRESCGCDAYDGRDVTPIYLRRRLPNDRAETDETISSISFRNQMFERLGEDSWTVRYLDSVLRDRVRAPYVPVGTAGYGLWTSGGWATRDRWNEKLQRREVQTLMPVHTRRVDEALDRGTLYKALSTNAGAIPAPLLDLKEYANQLSDLLTNQEEDNLRLDGRPIASKLYYRYVPAMSS